MSNGGVVTETPSVCDCGGEVKWESILDPYRERWLGVCECGNMQAFLPDTPAWVTDDPLTTFLAGPEMKTRPRERPPWVRLFLVSSQDSCSMSWSHVPGKCPGCGVQTIFAGRHGRGPLMPGATNLTVLCLACGFVRVADGTTKGPTRYLTGNQWTPPCPAVKRLRRLAFTPPMMVRIEECD